MTFEEELEERTARTLEAIQFFMPLEDDLDAYTQTLVEAMRYAFFAGGKRLRPLLLLTTYELMGGDDEERVAAPFAAAIEMIHTYSLVHDDLPAMDDDDLRRGQPTTHIVYGEGMAVLAGDALLNQAYETVLDNVARFPKKAFADGSTLMTRGIRAMQLLASCAGIWGMIGGQCADLCAETKEKPYRMADANIELSGRGSEEEIRYIYNNKTAALLDAAISCGAILAGVDHEIEDLLEQAAYDLGFAFQIRDDILDVKGDTKTLGKQTGQDDKNLKLTYVRLHGMEAAKQEVLRLSERAIGRIHDATKRIPQAKKNENTKRTALFLEQLIRSLTGRDR